MENCCVNLCGVFKNKKRKEEEEPGEDWPEKINNNNTNKLVVLKEPTGQEIGLRYELGRELGRGEFGITYLCKDKQTGEEFACKSISKNKLKKASDIEDLRRQVEIMKHLPEHPNIVSLKYTYEDENDVHLVSELCQGGNLLDRILARRRFYREKSAASVIKTVVKLVQMCHEHGVMLRNLKLENFLFADKTESAPLKVVDFHLSIFFQPGERLNQIVGNLYYMAPEVLKRNYGPEIDIWSAGVILYMLLCGFPPVCAETEQGITRAIIQSDIEFKCLIWDYGPYVSDGAQDLVKKMLDHDPMRRLSAKQVLAHPWLIEYVKKKSEQYRIIRKLDADDLRRTWLNAQNHIDMLNEKEEPGNPWLLSAKLAPNVSSGETIRAKLLQYSKMRHLTKTTSMVIAEYLCLEANIESERSWVMDTGTTAGNNVYSEVASKFRDSQQIPDVTVQRLIDYCARAAGKAYLDYREFLDLSIQLRKLSHEEHIDRAFRYFDRKQSGYIEFEELRKALADEVDRNNKEVINATMQRLNTNKDRRISYEEITNRSFKPVKEWLPELINKILEMTLEND